MISLFIPAWMLLPFLFVLGAVIGSFLNVCIHRIPRHRTLWEQLRGLSHPKSHCPKCTTPILWYDNVPILGWLRLGGRCRECGLAISPRYPLIELFNGLLFVGVYLMEVPVDPGASLLDTCLWSRLGPQSIDGLSPRAWVHLRYAYHMVLIEALMVATFIDFDTMTIPDGATVPAMCLGFIGAAAVGQVFLVPVWYQDPLQLRSLPLLLGYESLAAAPGWLQAACSAGEYPRWIVEYPRLHNLAVSVAGFVVGGGVVWAVRIIGHWALKREAMGFGDVILMAMIGSFIGWQPVIVVFFLAPVCALAVVALMWIVRRDQVIPYGPYLSLATLLLLLGFKRIWKVAEPVFALGILIPFLALATAAALAVTLQAMQLVKRVLGIPLYPPPEHHFDWRAADQLHYHAGEQVDPCQGRWKRSERWPGEASGRGQGFEEQWRGE